MIGVDRPQLASCLYVGHLRHRRFAPRPHGFRFSLFMVFVDLAELDSIFRRRWLWSTRHRAIAWLSREDHFGDPALPLDVCVRDLVERETGVRPKGAIRLLTHLRYFGYCFNPISIYYCYSETGDRVETIVAEVTNTPWHERHCYVLSGGNLHSSSHRYRFDKAMHVSPFMPMALEYEWRCNEPGARLAVHMDVLQAGRKLFDATLVLERHAITGPALAAILVRFPMMTFKVLVAIHWEALRLWLKKIPIFDHPCQNL